MLTLYIRELLIQNLGLSNAFINGLLPVFPQSKQTSLCILILK